MAVKVQSHQVLAVLEAVPVLRPSFRGLLLCRWDALLQQGIMLRLRVSVRQSARHSDFAKTQALSTHDACSMHSRMLVAPTQCSSPSSTLASSAPPSEGVKAVRL